MVPLKMLLSARRSGTWIVMGCACASLLFPGSLVAQAQRRFLNDKGGGLDTPLPHPLSYWTVDPLRLDVTGDLMIGYRSDDGKKLKSNSYNVTQQVTTLGVLGRHRIVQVMTSIEGKPGIRLGGFAIRGESPSQWKSLLVEEQQNAFVEIYQLHSQGGLFRPLTSAVVYGKGVDSYLGTYDPDSGNGGGCGDGYWWFDQAGPHLLNFDPVYAAMSKAAPPHSTYTQGCWTMHPQQSYIKTWAQTANAACLGCGGLGELRATYRVHQGVAQPVKVEFVPDPQQ